MREGKFIDKNVERWKEYMEPSDDPDVQAERFVNLVDDLSYSKTHYQQSKTTQFINGLAAQQFQKIYQHKKHRFERLFIFWKFELPLVFRKYLKTYLFTFCFFTAAVIIGVLSSMSDGQFVRQILGDGYVEMTEENIRKGDPFGVYKNGNEFGMFVNIAANNIRVALMAFALGIVACVGTLYILFSNGLMLGTFQHMFFAKGLGWKSILVVWIHGTIEISAIVIAGTAGLIIGNAFLFPGTYSRTDSLKMGAKDAVKVIIGLIPFFLIAAFFEGFITRHTEMPVWLSLLILIGSALLIIWYFIVYPILLGKSGIQVVKGEVIYPEQHD
jgi:uncharacterized membrane protein SpoIIM required for sporulation